MIYTSYFGNKHIPKEMHRRVIANSQPKGCNFKTELKLIPSWVLVSGYKNGSITPKEYAAEYTKQLDQINFSKLIEKYEDSENDIVLLCWESPEKFCHRHLLANYLNKKYGCHVKEYPY